MSKKELSNRLSSKKVTLFNELERKDWQSDELAKSVLGANDILYKNGEGLPGLGTGPYGDHHKNLRQLWQRTQFPGTQLF